MFSKAALSLTVLAVARFALAQNPACLLTAVNAFTHPADQETLCCKLANEFEKEIDSACDSQKGDALEAYKDICKAAGYTDCGDDKHSSSSSSHSKTSSKKSEHTSAPYPTASGSATVTGSTGFVTASNPVATGTNVPIPSGASGAGSGPAATGSPISPAAPGETGAGSSPSGESFTGAATKNVGSVAAGLLAVAGIVLAL